MTNSTSTSPCLSCSPAGAPPVPSLQIANGRLDSLDKTPSFLVAARSPPSSVLDLRDFVRIRVYIKPRYPARLHPGLTCTKFKLLHPATFRTAFRSPEKITRRSRSRSRSSQKCRQRTARPRIGKPSPTSPQFRSVTLEIMSTIPGLKPIMPAQSCTCSQKTSRRSSRLSTRRDNAGKRLSLWARGILPVI